MPSFSKLVDFIQENENFSSEPPRDNPRPPRPDWLTDELVRSSEDLTDDDDLDIPEGEPVDLAKLRDPNWGVDVLACYLPFHFCKKEWGIYIRAKGIVALATTLAGGPIFGRGSKAADIARRALFEHEYFHCAAETAFSRMEVVLPPDILLASDEASDAHIEPRKYAAYFADKAAAEREEALANARLWLYGLRGANSSMKCSCANFMLAQGPGYQAFVQFATHRTFIKGCRQAAGDLVLKGLRDRGFSTVSSIGDDSKTPPSEFLFEGIPKSLVPTRLVNDTKPPIAVIRRFPKYNGMQVEVYSRDHLPPHVHIIYDQGTTRYIWPDHWPDEIPNKPYDPDRDHVLSHKNTENFKKYLERYGAKIDQKVKQCLPAWQQLSGRAS